MTVPPDAITAAARVIHSLMCGECDYDPRDLTVVTARDRDDAAKVLEAAAPLIAAAERDRLRRFAEGLVQPEHQYVRRELLKLLDGAP